MNCIVIILFVLFLCWNLLSFTTKRLGYVQNLEIKYKLKRLREIVEPIFTLYNVSPNVIRFSENNKSYCYDKKLIYIQFYTKSKKIHEMADLIEMTLHELAHIVCKNCIDIYDHSPEYYSHYNKIIMYSIYLGILDKTNCIFDAGCEISKK